MNEYRRLDWTEILEKISGFATCMRAKEKIMDTQSFSSSEEALTHCRKVIESVSVIQSGIRPHMESLDIYSSWYSRLEKRAVLKTLELKDVRHFCIECLALKETLSGHSAGFLAQTSNELLEAQEPLSAIEQIMTPDGEIRNDASELVYKLLQEKTSETKKLQNTLEKIVKNFEMESYLQEKYVTTREGRWVLPIKSGMRHQLKGIIHASSQSKQTVFMEPQEVVDINNRLKQIDAELEEEIERLLKELSEYLFGLKDQMKLSHELMLQMDILLSFARFAHQIKARPFEFSNTEMLIEDLRHPMLALGPQEVIPNSVKFDSESRILLLSGPNAGGKTVLLKSIGLAAHMARCGLPISAEKARLPFFRNISITIGDEQSVDAHLSTFAAHLKSLDRATQFRGIDNLILIDEICGSTDPEEGAALAKSFIEVYSQHGVFAVITSHLGSLKLNWQEQYAIQHGSLEFSADKGPTYHLLKGIAGQSMAIQTAKRTGIAKNIIDRAMELIKPEKRKQMEELEEIESLKDKLHKILSESAAEKKELNAKKLQYEKLLRDFEKEKEAQLQKVLKESQQKFTELLKEENVRGIFQKHEKITKIKAEMPQIIKASNVLSQEPHVDSPEQFAKTYPAGSKVFIQSLGQDAIVQGRPNSKGFVQVLSRSMRLTLPWQDLTPPMAAENPTREILRKSGHFSYSPTDKDMTIDLRGMNSDEAIAKLEAELDKAASQDQDRVKVIHGHGTNTLKKLVRSFLSKSIYVKKWQSGSTESGGDGVTWAEL